MTITKNKPNFTFRVIKNGKTVDKCQTHSKRRFYDRIRSINWKNGVDSVYLRVSYGKGINSQGKITNFHNDGDYKTKGDLLWALTAFTEEI